MEMKIGKYKLGRYHAIIEKEMEDNTAMYETDFSSEKDLQESVSAIAYCIANKVVCGSATDNPMKILGMKVYKGKEAIDKAIVMLTPITSS